ncbi:MAG: hypothetical protein WBA73_13985 [Devosia sp.]
MTPRRTETISVGHELAGTINQTDRGFELFDAKGKYLHTQPTIQAARKALFELHRDGERGLEEA